ncbi:formate--tetrahydrofolate ligase [Eubacteriales bacterium OttesenSCG-928-A19]|nr:formate--tetrahydrofolate ligase [Eubacteriales bacterium OttesenSCG-928-A19]
MPSDLDIARGAKPLSIEEIATKAGLRQDTWAPYGRGKAKVDAAAYADMPLKAKLVLVTAITPTPAGEGKTTVSVGLADALSRLGKRTMLALREPSLGPVFGVKGGAAGGGHAQVIPMEDINLHFTGDLHAITTANNLLAAMIDNHILQGNALGIDPRQVLWRRCMDMNDRQLRDIVDGLGGRTNGTPREDGFDITAASEVMAAFCLAGDIADLRARLGRILVARTYAGEPVYAEQLEAPGAMTALLRDALQPNLVQTLEHTPALVHGGPFANIAHGCNTVIATKLAMRLSDIVVTEAGFGADLGAEKFIDIKCRMGGLRPDAVVLVATIRALKMHGGVPKAELGAENLGSLKKGLPNLMRHLHNVREVWGLPVTVAVNRFTADTQAEIDLVIEAVRAAGAEVAFCDVWANGGAGGEDLGRAVLRAMEQSSHFAFTYPDTLPLKDKIAAVCERIYGAKSIAWGRGVLTQLQKLEAEGCGEMPVCIAKTQYSFSDNQKLLGAPDGFEITIRSVRLSRGAGFVVAFAGDIIAMPGLPPKPAANGIGVDAHGDIYGLF